MAKAASIHFHCIIQVKDSVSVDHLVLTALMAFMGFALLYRGEVIFHSTCCLSSPYEYDKLQVRFFSEAFE